MGEQALRAQVLDDAVGQRHLVLVDAVDAHQAQRGARAVGVERHDFRRAAGQVGGVYKRVEPTFLKRFHEKRTVARSARCTQPKTVASLTGL